MLDARKRTWAEVKISAFQYNLYKFRERLPADCKIMGVLKANAYGHGAVQVGKLMEKFRCDYIGVATLDEAEQLRAGGITIPILILSYTPAEFIGRVVAANCAQTIGSLDAAKAYARVLEKAGLTLRVHIKLETGMGRTGFDVKNGDSSQVVAALGLKGIEPEGIFSHFSVADDPAERDYTLKQFELFEAAVADIEKKSGKNFTIKHCANSAAMISYPETMLNMVRCGIALYGVFPGEDHKGFSLAPAMELKTRVIQVSELKAGESVSYGRRFTADTPMRVAVLPIGYADGLHRALSGKIDVLIRGKRCRQIGTICMDMCMVDVSDVPEAHIGDVAVIFGHDDDEVISVNELAEKAGTISYEMLCAVSPRVPRVYVR